MQEHCTKVELYGTLTEVPAHHEGTFRWKGLEVQVKRNNAITEEHPLPTKIFMILSKEGAILAKFEVLDIDGEYKDAR